MLIPKIDFDLKEVFYDGPHLVGDIKRSVIIEIMHNNSSIKFNKPSLFLIKNQAIEILQLDELLSIKEQEFDLNLVIRKINEFDKMH